MGDTGGPKVQEAQRSPAKPAEEAQPALIGAEQAPQGATWAPLLRGGVAAPPILPPSLMRTSENSVRGLSNARAGYILHLQQVHGNQRTTQFLMRVKTETAAADTERKPGANGHLPETDGKTISPERQATTPNGRSNGQHPQPNGGGSPEDKADQSQPLLLGGPSTSTTTASSGPEEVQKGAPKSNGALPEMGQARTTGPVKPAGGAASAGPSAIPAVAAGGPMAGGTGAGGNERMPAAEIDTTSAEGVLNSLATIPASEFGRAVSEAKSAASAIETREKSELASTFPSIPQPTGLPRTEEPEKGAQTTLAAGQAPDLRGEAGGRHGTAPQMTHQAAPGPLPASRVSTAAQEPAADEGGSWWSWLVNRVRNFLGSLPTRDTTISTSAGERQRVDLSGDANPAQNAEAKVASDQEVTTRLSDADKATTADFGETKILPTIPTGQLRTTYLPSPPPAPRPGAAPELPDLPASARSQLDQELQPWLNTKVSEKTQHHEQERSAYQQKSKATQEDGDRKIAAETEKTRAEQEGLRQRARADVTAERTRWQAENKKIKADYETKAGAKRLEIDRQIETKVQSTHQEADRKLAEAEHQADAEKSRAEAEAAAKKREEESRPRSWWDRVKGAVADAFDAIRSAVNAIFDKLRKLVKQIIEAAKAAVNALIEAARAAIVGLIHAFGEFLKGLVTLALAAFPEAAARARQWIDQKVSNATDAVNRAAERLKQAANAILDGVAKALDFALAVLQKSYNLMLDAMEFLATLPFKAAELLAKLIKFLEKFKPFLEGAKKVEQNPDTIIEGLRAAIGGLIAGVPAKAEAVMTTVAAKLGRRAKKHLTGIWNHLKKGLLHLKDHWWDELKKLGWNLLWPWPAVWTDLKAIWQEIKSAFQAIWDLKISEAIDHQLTIAQKINSILGNLYGWFFIASVLIGAIIGAFFGGAGAIPGALAGAAFAGEVGEALLVALVATETAVIAKSAVDLALDRNTPQQDEEDYSKIAGSVLTLAITGALVLVGELAAKLAKAIWEGVSGLFKGEKGAEVRAGAPEGAPEAGGETKPGESLPEGEPGKSGAEGESEVIEVTPEGEKIVAKEPTPDGQHEVKVTEEGEVLLCSTCDLMRKEFAAELKDPANKQLLDDLNAADQIADPAQKAKVEAEIEQRLEAARQARNDALAIDPQAKRPLPKSIAERDAILQAERDGFVQDARRPNLDAGEPNLDFKVKDGWVDVKTPDTKFRSLQQNVADIAGKCKLYGTDVKVVIDLVNLSPADKITFMSELAKQGVDMSRIHFVNK